MYNLIGLHLIYENNLLTWNYTKTAKFRDDKIYDIYSKYVFNISIIINNVTFI